MHKSFPTRWTPRLKAIGSGELTLDELIQVLREGYRTERSEAARALIPHGSHAVEPLLEALDGVDGDVEAQVAAAKALGQIDDPRVAPALVARLRKPLVGRSSRRHFLATMVLLAAVLFFGLIDIYTLFVRSRRSFLSMLCLLVFVFIARVLGRSDSPRFTAMVSALEQIARRRDDPALPEALPLLQGIAAYPLIHQKEARQTAREAARRVEALTAAARNLPRPAEAPSAAGLPRAGAAPAMDVGTLPAPTEAPTCCPGTAGTEGGGPAACED
jgi:HEAT repeat protein